MKYLWETAKAAGRKRRAGHMMKSYKVWPDDLPDSDSGGHSGALPIWVIYGLRSRRSHHWASHEHSHNAVVEYYPRLSPMWLYTLLLRHRLPSSGLNPVFPSATVSCSMTVVSLARLRRLCDEFSLRGLFSSGRIHLRSAGRWGGHVSDSWVLRINFSSSSNHIWLNMSLLSYVCLAIIINIG